MVKGLPASPLLQTHGRRPDKRAANGARGFVGLDPMRKKIAAVKGSGALSYLDSAETLQLLIARAFRAVGGRWVPAAHA